MTRDFKEALRHRRTYYHITNSSPISDEQIKEIIDFAVMNVPSAFNSQSTRIVLLLGKNHKKLWEITKETLKRLVSAEVFKGTEAKIDGSLAAGYGTILFFEDKTVVEQLQDSFPTYYDKFPVWAQQTSAMHQLAIWTMLEDAGLGVSLQHYNPLIDETVYADAFRNADGGTRTERDQTVRQKSPGFQVKEHKHELRYCNHRRRTGRLYRSRTGSRRRPENRPL